MTKQDTMELVGQFGSASEAIHAAEEREGIVVLCVKEGVIHGAAYLCPCGCGHVHYARQQGHGERPTWIITLNEGRITFNPSVRCTSGCKSHFDLVDGKIKWHEDT